MGEVFFCGHVERNATDSVLSRDVLTFLIRTRAGSLNVESPDHLVVKCDVFVDSIWRLELVANCISHATGDVVGFHSRSNVNREVLLARVATGKHLVLAWEVVVQPLVDRTVVLRLDLQVQFPSTLVHVCLRVVGCHSTKPWRPCVHIFLGSILLGLGFDLPRSRSRCCWRGRLRVDRLLGRR